MGTRAYELLLMVFSVLANITSKVLVSMSIFLILGSGLFHNYNRNMIGSVFLSFIISNVLILIGKETYLAPNQKKSRGFVDDKEKYVKIREIITICVLSMIFTLTVFWLTYGIAGSVVNVTSLELMLGTVGSSLLIRDNGLGKGWCWFCGGVNRKIRDGLLVTNRMR